MFLLVVMDVHVMVYQIQLPTTSDWCCHGHQPTATIQSIHEWMSCEQLVIGQSPTKLKCMNKLMNFIWLIITQYITVYYSRNLNYLSKLMIVHCMSSQLKSAH